MPYCRCAQITCLPMSSGRGEGGFDETLYILSAILLLSRAEYFVGHLSTDFGRTVHELFQSRCCNMNKACVPPTFDVDHVNSLQAWTPSSAGKGAGARAAHE